MGNDSIILASGMGTKHPPSDKALHMVTEQVDLKEVYKETVSPLSTFSPMAMPNSKKRYGPRKMDSNILVQQPQAQYQIIND